MPTHLTASVVIKCYYISPDGKYLKNNYTCNVENDLSIMSYEEAVINSNTGTHYSGNNNDDVYGLHIIKKIVHYFPRGLDKIFKKLRGIIIKKSGLKQISQSDIRKFSDLVYLGLKGNDIKVLDEGLFDFNPKLQFVGLRENKITNIHPNVFNNLDELIHLDLRSNLCIDLSALNNRIQVENIIRITRLQCPRINAVLSEDAETLNKPHVEFDKSTCGKSIVGHGNIIGGAQIPKDFFPW